MAGKWKAKAEDLGDGNISEVIAGSHPHRLLVQVNLFTKKVEFLYTKDYEEYISFETVEEAISYFNEVI